MKWWTTWSGACCGAWGSKMSCTCHWQGLESAARAGIACDQAGQPAARQIRSRPRQQWDAAGDDPGHPVARMASRMPPAVYFAADPAAAQPVFLLSPPPASTARIWTATRAPPAAIHPWSMTGADPRAAAARQVRQCTPGSNGSTAWQLYLEKFPFVKDLESIITAKPLYTLSHRPGSAASITAAGLVIKRNGLPMNEEHLRESSTAGRAFLRLARRAGTPPGDDPGMRPASALPGAYWRMAAAWACTWTRSVTTPTRRWAWISTLERTVEAHQLVEAGVVRGRRKTAIPRRYCLTWSSATRCSSTCRMTARPSAKSCGCCGQAAGLPFLSPTAAIPSRRTASTGGASTTLAIFLWSITCPAPCATGWPRTCASILPATCAKLFAGLPIRVVSADDHLRRVR